MSFSLRDWNVRGSSLHLSPAHRQPSVSSTSESPPVVHGRRDGPTALRLPAIPPRPGAVNVDTFLDDQRNRDAARGKEIVETLRRRFGESIFTPKIDDGVENDARRAASLLKQLTAAEPTETPPRNIMTRPVSELERSADLKQQALVAALSTLSPSSIMLSKHNQSEGPPRPLARTPGPKKVTGVTAPSQTVVPNYDLQMRLEARLRSKREKSGDQQKLDAERVMEEASVLRRIRHLETLNRELCLVQDVAHESLKRAEAVTKAQALRRNAGTIADEWRGETENHPMSEHERDAADRARAERRFMRRINEGRKDEVARLQRIRDALEATRRWKIPHGVKVDVYKVPRVSCLCETTLAGEMLVDEVETLTQGNILWVKIYATGLTGWVAAQFASEGQVRVQLLPEADRCGTTVGEFMLETLDDITDEIDRAMQHCAIERMKGASEAKEALTQSVVQRQLLRELPSGHATFLQETWQTMVSGSRFPKLMREVQLRGDDVETALDESELGTMLAS